MRSYCHYMQYSYYYFRCCCRIRCFYHYNAVLLSLYAVLLSSYSVLLPLYAVLLSLYSVLLSLGASLVIRWWFVGSFGQRFPDAGQRLHSFLLAFLPSWFCLTVIYIYFTKKPSFNLHNGKFSPSNVQYFEKTWLRPSLR